MDKEVKDLVGKEPSHYTVVCGGPWLEWDKGAKIHRATVFDNVTKPEVAYVNLYTYESNSKVYVCAYSLKFAAPTPAHASIEWDAYNGWRHHKYEAQELTEGTKFDGEKPRADLLSVYSMDQLIAVLTFGGQKYADHNWRKGIKTSRLLAAALRHIFAYMGGEDKDKETGLSHIAHAMCCCMFIIEQDKYRKEFDDRYKLPAAKE